MSKRDRDIGDRLEREVGKLLGIRQSARSGAHWDNADLVNDRIIIECKYKDVSGFRAPGKDLPKLINQADKHGKEWAYVQKNQAGTFVLVSLDLFTEMFEAWRTHA